jgi:hypothetical protein
LQQWSDRTLAMGIMTDQHLEWCGFHSPGT